MIARKKYRCTITTILLWALASFVLYFSCSGSEDNPLVGPIGGEDVIPPQKPALPSLTSVGNGEIHIIWANSSENDIGGYKLYRAENEDLPGNYNVIYDSTATSYKDLYLEYETTYFYRVSAYDLTGNESEKSDPVSGTPRNITPPATPKNVTVLAQNITDPFIQITWDKNTESDLSGYKIYRAERIDFSIGPASFVDSTVNTFYTDPEIFVDTVYYYKLTSIDKGGMESINPSFPESDVALPTPNLLSPVNDQSVAPNPTLTWEPVSKTNLYKVFIQTTSQGGEFWSRTVDKAQTSLQYNGSTVLESGRFYFWKVATITKDSLSLNSFSSPARFRIQ